jgi:hypothetical protein
MFLQPHWFDRWGFLFPITFDGMEGVSDQLPTKPNTEDTLAAQKQRVKAASGLLSICDRLSTGYDSGYYWEDIQRALRIAAGIEKWPD